LFQPEDEPSREAGQLINANVDTDGITEYQCYWEITAAEIQDDANNQQN
jgi:hypothetical protein